MTRRVCETTQANKEIANVVFNQCLKTFVAGFFGVKACGRVLQQRLVNVILAVVCEPDVLQNRCVLIVKLTFQIVVRAVGKKWSCFSMSSECIFIAVGNSFDDGAIQQSAEPLFAVEITEPTQRIVKRDAGLIDCAFAPITDGEIHSSFSTLLRQFQPFESARRLLDEVLSNFLGA